MPSQFFDLVIRTARAVVGGEERAVEVGVTGGRIGEVAPAGADLIGERLVELGPDEVLLPGFVDSHVHSGDPGRTEWEGFATLTRAAAAGGVTTIVDMPIDSTPPTTSRAGLEAKIAAVTSARPVVDVALWGGLVPWNADELRGMVAGGALGIKAFLAETGDPDFPAVGIEMIEVALELLAPLGMPLLVHCEAPDPAPAAAAIGTTYESYLRAHPPEREIVAVRRLIAAAARTGGWAHVVHVSGADAAALIGSARRQGVRISAETCPHYLALAAEEIPDGDTRFKCSPPIRDAANRERLWGALADRTIAQVVSDHSPCLPAMKLAPDRTFANAWSGISSLQVAPAVMWTAAAARGYGLVDLVRWMSDGPSRLAGLTSKGAIAPGRDADLVVFAPDEAFKVVADRLEHRHPVTPYAGRTLRGRVRRTILRGMDAFPFEGSKPSGRFISSARGPLT